MIWNSIEESKPGILGTYLIYFKDGQGINKMGWAFYNSEKSWALDNTLVTPTHWMELPKPPKVKS